MEPPFVLANLNRFPQEPFDSLAETVLAVRDLPDEPSRCSRWWCFLNTARTFFEGQASQ
jgi:hypothetical protein